MPERAQYPAHVCPIFEKYPEKWSDQACEMVCSTSRLRTCMGSVAMQQFFP